jgi:hypothetical protein
LRHHDRIVSRTQSSPTKSCFRADGIGARFPLPAPGRGGCSSFRCLQPASPFASVAVGGLWSADQDPLCSGCVRARAQPHPRPGHPGLRFPRQGPHRHHPPPPDRVCCTAPRSLGWAESSHRSSASMPRSPRRLASHALTDSSSATTARCRSTHDPCAPRFVACQWAPHAFPDTRKRLMASMCRVRSSSSRTPSPSPGARHRTPTLPWWRLRWTS